MRFNLLGDLSVMEPNTQTQNQGFMAKKVLKLNDCYHTINDLSAQLINQLTQRVSR
jgi:hypothetical protein